MGSMLPYEAERHEMLKAIEVLKEAVRIEDVAAEYTELRRVSDERYEGRCPFPDHEDRNPSFSVYPESGRYQCFVCGGGDVIDLEETAGGFAEVRWAVVSLATRYGVELPGRRAPGWHDGEARKVEYVRACHEVVGEVLCRRLYKTLILPYIEAIEDPVERERELERSWAAWRGRSHSYFWSDMARGVLSGEDEGRLVTIAKVYAETRPELAEKLLEATS